MQRRPHASSLLLAVLASAGTAGQQPHEDCSRTALHTLAIQGYGHRIWESLGEIRRLEDSCGAGDAAGYYRIHRAQLESFVGNHRIALQFADRGEPGPKESETLPGNVQSVDAVAYLTRRASSRRIMMVNERHHVSTDRLLTLSLLKPLADLGFRYLALEAVFGGDDVNGRGYAVGETGYYTNDPVFAEVVREAVHLGYEVVAYEFEREQGGKGVDGVEPGGQEERDYWQARNLVERVFEKDPKAKALVHCGYSHLLKTPSPRWVPMGYFLTQMTGLEPLTVDQVKLSERGSAEFEDPMRAQAERLGLVADSPVVLVDGEGAPVAAREGVDVTVLGPRTSYREGRPTWMAMDGRRRAVAVEVPECEKRSCILEARTVNRPDSVPLDRMEASHESSAALYLPLAADAEVQVFDARTQERLGQQRVNVDFGQP